AHRSKSTAARLHSAKNCGIQPNRNVRYGHSFAGQGRTVHTEIKQHGEDEPTPRQGEVLDAVLALLVEGKDAVTMNAVARRASCSKETLYKWFGDRDGLMTATVRWQASRVRAGNYDSQKLDAATLRESLERFAANW